MTSTSLPSLNALRAFCVAAKHLSVSAAADQLNVTQSAVSKQIRSLEQHLAVSLFIRRAHGIDLTPQGKQLASSLEQAFSQIEHAVTEVMPQKMHLQLLVPITFAARWMAPRLVSFQQRHPHIHVNLSSALGGDGQQAQNADISIVTTKEEMQGEEWQLLYQEQLVPVCSPDWLAAHPILSAEDLLHVPKLHCGDKHEDWRTWLQGMALPAEELGAGLAFDTIDLTLHAAMTGCGVTMADRYILKQELVDKRLVIALDLAVPGLYRYYLHVPSKKRQQQNVRAFLNWFEGEFQHWLKELNIVA